MTEIVKDSRGRVPNYVLEKGGMIGDAAPWQLRHQPTGLTEPVPTSTPKPTKAQVAAAHRRLDKQIEERKGFTV